MIFWMHEHDSLWKKKNLHIPVSSSLLICKHVKHLKGVSISIAEGEGILWMFLLSSFLSWSNGSPNTTLKSLILVSEVFKVLWYNKFLCLSDSKSTTLQELWGCKHDGASLNSNCCDVIILCCYSKSIHFLLIIKKKLSTALYEGRSATVIIILHNIIVKC